MAAIFLEDEIASSDPDNNEPEPIPFNAMESRDRGGER